jgi:hypothetical protein
VSVSECTAHARTRARYEVSSQSMECAKVDYKIAQVMLLQARFKESEVCWRERVCVCWLWVVWGVCARACDHPLTRISCTRTPQTLLQKALQTYRRERGDVDGDVARCVGWGC